MGGAVPVLLHLLAWLAALAALAALVLFGLPWLLRFPVDDLLPPQPEPVPHEQNGWVALQDVVLTLCGQGEPGAAAESAALRAVLVPPDGTPELDAILDAVVEAMRRPFYVAPVAGHHLADAPHEARRINAVGSLIMALSRRASRRIGAGQTQQGLQDLLALCDLVVHRAVASYDSVLNAGSLLSARIALVDCLGPTPDLDPGVQDPTEDWPRPDWSKAERELWGQALTRLRGWTEQPDIRRSLARSILHEAAAWDDAPRWRCALLDHEHARWVELRHLAAWVERASLPPWERGREEPEPYAGLACWWRWYSPLSRCAFGYQPVTHRLSVALIDRVWSCFEAGVVAVALKLYLYDHGRLPTSLANLVSLGYLSDLPRDRFTGEALGYDPRRGLLWSVGELASAIWERDPWNYAGLKARVEERCPDTAERAAFRLTEYAHLPFVVSQAPQDLEPWWGVPPTELDG